MNTEKLEQENDQKYFVNFSHPNNLSRVFIMVKKHEHAVIINGSFA